MVATELAPGALLGEGDRYRLERLLGTGGMASVWLAHDSRLGRPVAIKVLADSLALDPGYISRFEREARVAAQLSHPSLVKVFDFSARPPRQHLVMEFVAGGTLADRLRDPGIRDWDPETVFRELLSALACIHEAGVIHRDIKPGNVLIGTDGRARLTDFGIARPSGGTELTSTGLVIGTARYIAPEVLRGHRADERSDLYACGVLLRDCLRDGPRSLHALADKLTAADPERRPRSAAATLELLDRRVAQRPRLPPSASVFRSHTPHISRQGREIRLRLTRSSVAITAVVLVFVAVFVALAAGGSGGGHRRSTSTPGRPVRSTPTLSAPPAGAPLTEQLDYLDRLIQRARR